MSSRYIAGISLPVTAANSILSTICAMPKYSTKAGGMLRRYSLNCGHIVAGTKAPAVCPVCSLPQSYFELKAENH